MALEMMNKENLDNKINNEPLNINFSKTLKHVIEDAKKRVDKYINESNDIKKKILDDDNLSNNTGIKEMIGFIDDYLSIVTDEPATKTYYLNALEDMLIKLNILINKVKKNNNTNKPTNTNIKDNIKNSEQSNEGGLKDLIENDDWMNANEGIHNIQLK